MRPGTRRTATRLAATSILALAPAVALAHRPYEYQVATVTDARGRSLCIFKAFTDGIVLPDPVTLEVRDCGGRTHARSPRLTDVAVLCHDDSSCLAFGYDSLRWTFLPIEVWRISGPELTPVTTPRLRLAGVAVHIWNNWIGYVVALCSLLLPLPILQRIQRLSPSRVRSGLQVAAALVGALFVIPWYFIIVFSNLSLLILVVAALSVGLTSKRLGRLRRASGPTRR